MQRSRATTAVRATAAVEEATATMHTVNVSLGDRSYPIYIGRGLLDRPELLQRHIPGKKVLVVTNETIAPLYLDRWEPECAMQQPHH